MDMDMDGWGYAAMNFDKAVKNSSGVILGSSP